MVISFRINWFDLLAVQRTLKSLLQHQLESVKSSVLSLLYGPTHVRVGPYMATGKIIALTIQNFVSKAVSLLYNTLTRFAIAFLPSSVF